MFDSLIVQSRPVVVTHEHHDHRAPTDESVKLLREMEQKAEARIIESAVIQNNIFHGVIHSTKSFVDDRIVHRAVFSLNGRKMAAEFALHTFEATPEKMAIGLRDAIAKELATALLSGQTKAN